MPQHLLAVTGLFVAQTPVSVEKPAGGVGTVDVGGSIRAVARRLWPGRHTIGRWWHWLRTHVDEYGLHLRSRFPELGQAVDGNAFWSRCFERMSLGEAMGWLDSAGVVVP